MTSQAIVVQAAAKVAQVSNLLCRGFPIRMRYSDGAVCRLEVGDTAGWKPALRDRSARAEARGYEI